MMVAPAGMPAIEMVPCVCPRRPVPAATTSQFVQLDRNPVPTDQFVCVLGGAFVASAIAALIIMAVALGAFQRIVTVWTAPDTRSGRLTVSTAPGAGELGVPIGTLDTNVPVAGSVADSETPRAVTAPVLATVIAKSNSSPGNAPVGPD